MKLFNIFLLLGGIFLIGKGTLNIYYLVFLKKVPDKTNYKLKYCLKSVLYYLIPYLMKLLVGTLAIIYSFKGEASDYKILGVPYVIIFIIIIIETYTYEEFKERMDKKYLIKK